jgi:HEAT repeats
MPADRSSSEDDPAGWATRLPTDPASDGPVGAPELRIVLRSGPAAARADALRRAVPGPGVEPAVVEALSDPDPGVRVAAVHTLGRIAGAVGAWAVIQAAVQDPAPSVRIAALEVLEGELRRTAGAEPGSPA